ncbi:hypothetical protein ACH4FX_02000 [Streptomyces sp. NPDC018019]|uniref:hypothetical protein n=1 Tax=Streptomyces sp. NPDC018019 TaxID=3365030 RepID=UPI003792447A
MSTSPESRSEAAEASGASEADEEQAVRPARSERSEALAALIFDDPLSRPSSDDTDRGWGERPAGNDSAADLARFLDEKPPHHL